MHSPSRFFIFLLFPRWEALPRRRQRHTHFLSRKKTGAPKRKRNRQQSSSFSYRRANRTMLRFRRRAARSIVLCRSADYPLKDGSLELSARSSCPTGMLCTSFKTNVGWRPSMDASPGPFKEGGKRKPHLADAPLFFGIPKGFSFREKKSRWVVAADATRPLPPQAVILTHPALENTDRPKYPDFGL